MTKIPKLEVMQRYAERIARKLNTGCIPILRWNKETKTTEIIISSKDSNNPRGTIWLESAYHLAKDTRGWKWIIAHEVCHLKVKTHSSPYFSRYMARLGFNQMGEKQEAVAAGLMRHRHDWTPGKWLSPNWELEDNQFVARREAICKLCGKVRK